MPSFFIIAGLFFVPLLGFFWAIAAIIPGIMLSVRRFHDRGISGWWYLILFLILVLTYIMCKVGLHYDGSEEWIIIAGLCILLSRGSVLVIYCLPSKKGENKYGFNPIEMENILNHFKAIETICVGASSEGINSGNSNLFGFVAELEKLKGLFQQIYTAKERLNRMVLLNGTINGIEHIRHEVALQSENRKFLLEQLEQLENKLRSLPNPILG